MKRLKDAMRLRNEKELLKSNLLLVELAKQYPEDGNINYQCAWSFDILGKEEDAIEYYEKSLSLVLNEEDYLGAIIGLGSTLRCIGEYDKSKEIFEKGYLKYPEANSINVFYAMTLYNLNEHRKAMELLLNIICSTTNDREIIQYKSAIIEYARNLDKRYK